MKFYLAGGYSVRDELRGYRHFLVGLGHEVTSRWLDTNWTETNDKGSSAAPPEYREKYALIDLEDVREADVLIAFAADPYRKSGNNRGGRHVELGIAIGLGKLVVLVGQPENIFHYLPGVVRYDLFDDLYTDLRRGTLPA